MNPVEYDKDIIEETDIKIMDQNAMDLIADKRRQSLKS